MNVIGIQSLFQLISHMFFIFMTFWAMQGLRTDQWLKKHHVSQGKFLYLFAAIAIGYTVSSFFLDFILASQNLFYLFY